MRNLTVRHCCGQRLRGGWPQLQARKGTLLRGYRSSFATICWRARSSCGTWRSEDPRMKSTIFAAARSRRCDPSSLSSSPCCHASASSDNSNSETYGQRPLQLRTRTTCACTCDRAKSSISQTSEHLPDYQALYAVSGEAAVPGGRSHSLPGVPFRARVCGGKIKSHLTSNAA